MASIFTKPSDLKPSQLRTVADRRFEDAVALVNTRHNARANGAMYLAGFVIELLLKAQMLAEHPQLRTRTGAAVDARLSTLFWRSHDLSDILDALPALEGSLKKWSERDRRPYLLKLRGICGSWTVFARYSPLTTTIEEAQRMIEEIRELKEVLK